MTTGARGFERLSQTLASTASAASEASHAVDVEAARSIGVVLVDDAIAAMNAAGPGALGPVTVGTKQLPIGVVLTFPAPADGVPRADRQQPIPGPVVNAYYEGIERALRAQFGDALVAFGYNGATVAVIDASELRPRVEILEAHQVPFAPPRTIRVLVDAAGKSVLP